MTRHILDTYLPSFASAVHIKDDTNDRYPCDARRFERWLLERGDVSMSYQDNRRLKHGQNKVSGENQTTPNLLAPQPRNPCNLRPS